MQSLLNDLTDLAHFDELVNFEDGPSIVEVLS